MKKKTPCIALAFTMAFAALSLAACSSGKASFKADYPYYESIEEQVKISELIIEAEVISDGKSERIKIDTDSELPYTSSVAKVVNVIKGDVKVGDEIRIMQLGDASKPEKATNDMGSYLKKDTSQLLFLCRMGADAYEPLSPYQGIVEIKDGKLYSKSNSSHFGYKENETIEDAVEKIKAAVK